MYYDYYFRPTRYEQQIHETNDTNNNIQVQREENWVDAERIRIAQPIYNSNDGSYSNSWNADDFAFNYQLEKWWVVK